LPPRALGASGILVPPLAFGAWGIGGGWGTPLDAVSSIDELPGAARRYLDRIEELAETPIAYVSVGTRRDQIIGAR
jgi:adenylosuccinate synthase